MSQSETRHEALMIYKQYYYARKLFVPHGLSYSAAQRELKASWQNPDYGITIMGRGSHRVYILRK